MGVASGSPAASTPDGPATRRPSGGAVGLGKRFLLLREAPIILITIVAAVYFGFAAGNFFTIDSFKTLLPFFAPLAIFAAGEVFVMINGEIDLSIGSMYLFIPFWFQKIDSLGIGTIPSLILALATAVLLGAVNGFFVAYVGVASFVATLGMLLVLAGVTLTISHATPITPVGTTISGHPSTFETIFGHGTYSELFWALAVVIVLQVVLSFTRWGLYTVSVGSNKLQAAEAGIRVKRNLMGNFMVCALCAAFVGILETTRTTSATPDPSGPNALLFSAVSAAVIGGTILTGGSGTVIGALIGALFLGVLNDGLVLTGASANKQSLYLGLAVLVAATVLVLISRVRTGSGRG